MSLSAEKRAYAFEVRRLLNKLVKSYGLTDEAAFNENAALINTDSAAFPVWNPGADYDRGDVTIDPADGVPYWASHAQGKTSGQIHQPSVSPTMWLHCHGTTPETARPFVAEAANPYHTGHYCTENEKAYRCNQNNIIHAPSILPGAWDLVE